MTPTDPLLAAIDRQAADLNARVENLRRAAAGDVTVADRARTLLAFADAGDRIDELLDRIDYGTVPEGVA